jgi:hypothetical protein
MPYHLVLGREQVGLWNLSRYMLCFFSLNEKQIISLKGPEVSPMRCHGKTLCLHHNSQTVPPTFVPSPFTN